MESKTTIKAVTYILCGALLQMFNGIDDGWASGTVAIFGMVIFFRGLNKLKKILDEPGRSGVKLLIIAAVLSVIGFVFDMIPFVGGVVASIFIQIAFSVQFFGLLRLRKSATIGEEGRSGVMLLIIAIIMAILDYLFSIIPVIGGKVGTVFSIIALVLVFFGWVKVQMGLIETPATLENTTVNTGEL